MTDQTPAAVETSRPVLMAVDDDGPVLAAVERDLRDRYAEHYQVITAPLRGPGAGDPPRGEAARGTPSRCCSSTSACPA